MLERCCNATGIPTTRRIDTKERSHRRSSDFYPSEKWSVLGWYKFRMNYTRLGNAKLVARDLERKWQGCVCVCVCMCVWCVCLLSNVVPKKAKEGQEQDVQAQQWALYQQQQWGAYNFQQVCSLTLCQACVTAPHVHAHRARAAMVSSSGVLATSNTTNWLTGVVSIVIGMY